MEPILIAAKDGFALFERGSTSVWRSLKLVLQVSEAGKMKRNWWIAWNGERISRSSDAKHLAAHHPEIRQWVIETLKGADHDQRRAG